MSEYEHPEVPFPKRALSVDRAKGILHLWELRPEPRKLKTYAVSVGLEGYETPGGFHVINTAAIDPEWQVPNSDWAVEAGLEPGTVVPGGVPENPLKKRWLGVTRPSEGVGIHGTGAKSLLGDPASHGCIRMRPAAVVELFDLVPIGTPIYIE